MKIGSLFSGYGGLDLAVEHAFGARTVWQAEWEDAPSAVLARHWPGAPNLRDVTAVDWAAVEPVDIITGGFPCQDVSLAGRRAGMTEGTRSNLWGAMRSAVETIRPRYVVAENVRGLLSAHAESASDMEPREGLLGNRSGGHLRALGRVLGDLADLGYDAQWCGLRASDVGAPHHRFRIFILATRRGAEDTRSGGGRGRGAVPRAGKGGEPHAPTHGADSRHGGPRADVRRLEGVANAARDGRDEGRPESAGQFGGPHAPLGGAPGHVPDAHGHEPERGRGPGPVAGAPGTREGRKEERQRVRDAAGHRGADPADAHGTGLLGLGRLERAQRDPDGRCGADGPGPDSEPSAHQTDWGPYAAAVRRWEPVVGRRAPAPTELTDRGKHRLSPRFTEWMMGLPAGWITDTPGITRNEALKMCGNGVVPQQAAAALEHMLVTHDRPTPTSMPKWAEHGRMEA